MGEPDLGSIITPTLKEDLSYTAHQLLGFLYLWPKDGTHLIS